jgi:ArsR family transcriptional regulator, arsenate/arsenite/antimonite-responsive transcriptional repressor
LRPSRRIPKVGGTVRCCRSGPRIEPRNTRAYAPIFRALADETRLEILGLLAAAENGLCACDIAGRVRGLSQPTVSHHLRLLREAGLVTVVRERTWVWYALDRGTISRLRDFAALIAQ